MSDLDGLATALQSDSEAVLTRMLAFVHSPRVFEATGLLLTPGVNPDVAAATVLLACDIAEHVECRDREQWCKPEYWTYFIGSVVSHSRPFASDAERTLFLRQAASEAEEGRVFTARPKHAVLGPNRRFARLRDPESPQYAALQGEVMRMAGTSMSLPAAEVFGQGAQLSGPLSAPSPEDVLVGVQYGGDAPVGRVTNFRVLGEGTSDITPSLGERFRSISVSRRRAFELLRSWDNHELGIVETCEQMGISVSDAEMLSAEFIGALASVLRELLELFGEDEPDAS